MKKIILILATVFSLTACGGGWSQEDKDNFLKSCMEGGSDDSLSKQRMNKECNCRIELIMKKYPDMNNFMEHMDAVVKDTEMVKCHEEAMK